MNLFCVVAGSIFINSRCSKLFVSVQKRSQADATFPAITMKPDNAYTRTVRRAIALAGGVEELAAQLEVPSAEVEAWRTGERAPGVPQFLSLLDIVAGQPLPVRAKR
jgi:DNA-binding transcriptional regulator YiaG